MLGARCRLLTRLALAQKKLQLNVIALRFFSVVSGVTNASRFRVGSVQVESGDVNKTLLNCLLQALTTAVKSAD